jgi:valyl-tRNA synthetase
MDEGCSGGSEVFVSLYEKGLIYRGIISSTGAARHTTISDIEVSIR